MRPRHRGRGAPIAVTGTGVVSPIGNTLADFDDALFTGRSAVRARSLDLPGIDLPPVPVASADFDAAAVVAPSRVPMVSAPFIMNFMLLVPLASYPAVEI